MATKSAANGAATMKESASFVEQIAARIGATARASMVYGDPVERSGVTVIPVAKIRYGFGGGAGEGEGGDNAHGHGEGAGGGGGVVASPAGYIEIRDGASTYRAISSRGLPALLLMSGALSIMLAVRALSKRQCDS